MQGEAEIINLSVNETLPRTVMTSVTILLALIAMLLLGGHVLRPNTLGVADWRPLLDRCGHDLDGIAPGLYALQPVDLRKGDGAWRRL